MSSTGYLRTVCHLCVGVLLSFCALTGCDFRRVVINQPVPSELVQLLHPGESSFGDVVHVLGAPDDIDGTSAGMVLRYRHGDTKTMRVNFGWILRVFLPVVPSMHLGRGEGMSKVLHVAIDQKGILDHYLIEDPPVPPRFWFWPF